MRTWVGPVDDPRRYRFDDEPEPIASGGEGFVYRARRAADDQLVAVKQLVSVAPAEWGRQAGRIRLVGQVTHPNLGRHLDTFIGCYPFAGEVPPDEEFDSFYTVMAWVDGVDLTEAVADVDIPTAYGWVRDVARAAAALHRHPTPTGLGIVHRDIKPSNVRVTGRDAPEGPGRAVLIDFGIARPLDGATMTGNAGAPGWMPPEAFGDPHSVGVRSDTWQVGGLAAWIAVGLPPGALVAGERRDRLEETLAERQVPNGRRLARHIDRALAARPADRPTDLAHWGDELARLAATGGSGRRRAQVAAAALVALAGALVLTLAWPGDKTGPPVADGPPATTRPVIGEIHVEPNAQAPFDQDESVALTVTHTGTMPPAGATVQVEARAGGVPVALTGDGRRAPVTGPVQQLSFTVAEEAWRTPLVVDELVVRLDAPGTATVEQSEPVRLTFAPPIAPPEQCTSYDPSKLRIDHVAPLWRLQAEGTTIAEMFSESDARQVQVVAEQADARCLIGQPVGAASPVHYWRRQGRLIGPLPPSPLLANADCGSYRPEAVRLDRTRLVTDDEMLASFATPADAEQGLALARHYHRLCVIGRFGSSGPADYRRPTVSFWE